MTHSIENTREGGDLTAIDTGAVAARPLPLWRSWFNTDPAGASLLPSYTQKPTTSWVPLEQNHRQATPGGMTRKITLGAGETLWETRAATVDRVGGRWISTGPPAGNI